MTAITNPEIYVGKPVQRTRATLARLALWFGKATGTAQRRGRELLHVLLRVLLLGCYALACRLLRFLSGSTARTQVYDLVNAGPRHRFATAGAVVANCTIGLGYGMGASKFLLTCRTDRVTLDPVPKDQWDLNRSTKFQLLNIAHIDYRDPNREAEVSEFLAANAIVQQWRQANQPVVKLWANLQGILENAAANQLPSYSFVLPSGRKKTYYKPHFKTGNKIIIDPETMQKTNKPEKRLCASLIDGHPAEDLHGGPITENLVQATARDVMFSGAVDCADAGMDFLFNVYDEVAGEVPEAEAAKWETLMPQLLCQGSAKSWTAGLPLEVEGGVRDKYEK